MPVTGNAAAVPLVTRGFASSWPPAVPTLTFALVLVLVLALAGCGAGVERDGAARAADAFTASERTDPSAACAVLAPRTLAALEEDLPCPQALPATNLLAAGDRRSVTVAGHSAQVKYTGDTVFLALFDDGWKVTAAGCTRTSDDDSVPYDCTVDGG